jgi:hypothetical protein
VACIASPSKFAAGQGLVLERDLCTNVRVNGTILGLLKFASDGCCWPRLMGGIQIEMVSTPDKTEEERLSNCSDVPADTL